MEGLGMKFLFLNKNWLNEMLTTWSWTPVACASWQVSTLEIIQQQRFKQLGLQKFISVKHTNRHMTKRCRANHYQHPIFKGTGGRWRTHPGWCFVMPLIKAGLFKRNCSSPVSHQSGESHLLRGLNPDSSAHLIGNLIISDVDERKLKLASERAGLLWGSCAFPLLCKSWASPTGWLEGLLKIQWEKQRCALVSLVTLSPVTPADKRHRACLMNNVTWNIHDLFLMESSNNVKRESCNLQISHSNRRSNLFWFWTEDSKRNAPSEKHTSNIRIKIPHVQHRRGLWQPAKVLNVIGKNRKKQPISFQSVLLTPQCNFFSNQFGNNQPGCICRILWEGFVIFTHGALHFPGHSAEVPGCRHCSPNSSGKLS